MRNKDIYVRQLWINGHAHDVSLVRQKLIALAHGD